jgi:hypothetical protein
LRPSSHFAAEQGFPWLKSCCRAQYERKLRSASEFPQVTGLVLGRPENARVFELISLKTATRFAWWQQMRPRFFDGFHRCLPALATAGNDLIVERIIESRTGART